MATVKEKAKAFANDMKRQTEECPRDVMNPGLYFGYVAGAESLEKHLELFEESIRHSFKIREDALLAERDELVELRDDIYALTQCGQKTDMTEAIQDLIEAQTLENEIAHAALAKVEK